MCYFDQAGTITIAEVEEIVECGEIDPADVHIPGVYIQRVVKGASYEKRIEVSDTRTHPDCLQLMQLLNGSSVCLQA